ncbi:MAG: 23S rRNA (adenine(2030)-N(6))-methyltransferase RlmJ [Verrucomicrobia bacterium]|nr:23S rRNA (adenine(2030)-N(6))-methyltransferase RlmJ [Verrucomicrobiota bacterium]
MNYRHHFHAGNFADVAKHVLLVELVRALQKKEQGFLFVDSHAGRGSYDLERAATGDSLERRAEWPEGIGRLWTRGDLPAAVAGYVRLVREFDRRKGNLAPTPRFYPGSPWLVRLLARPADRMVLCELHPAECGALRAEWAEAPRCEVREGDGYAALRALLPPLERRALVLLDPPYEAPDELARLVDALREGIRRFPTGVYAAWYPLTGRACAAEIRAAVRELAPPPTLAAELTIAGADSPPKMKGCGLLIVNPPWQFERAVETAWRFLAAALAAAPGGGGEFEWLIKDT